MPLPQTQPEPSAGISACQRHARRQHLLARSWASSPARSFPQHTLLWTPGLCSSHFPDLWCPHSPHTETLPIGQRQLTCPPSSRTRRLPHRSHCRHWGLSGYLLCGWALFLTQPRPDWTPKPKQTFFHLTSLVPTPVSLTETQTPSPRTDSWPHLRGTCALPLHGGAESPRDAWAPPCPHLMDRKPAAWPRGSEEAGPLRLSIFISPGKRDTEAETMWSEKVNSPHLRGTPNRAGGQAPGRDTGKGGPGGREQAALCCGLLTFAKGKRCA